ncbi:MAG TPA: ATP-binding protein [Micromonosporaceae bacterium]
MSAGVGPVRVLLTSAERHRRRELTAALDAEPDIRIVAVLDRLPPADTDEHDVALVDQCLDERADELLAFDSFAHTHRTLATSTSVLRTDIWMMRSCGARGFANDPRDLPTAVRALATGREHWPAGLGDPPSWTGKPLLARLCTFLQERERAKYARLIHDHVLQTFEGLAVSPAIADAGLRQLLRREAAWLRNAIDPGRRRRPRSLAEALTKVAAQHQASDLEVALAISADPPLAPRVVHALAEATHEALTNTRKHAAARSASVAVVAGPDTVTVSVADCGGGFDPAVTAAGFGLRESISARLHEVGGQVSLHSVVGEGTVVRMTAPLPSAASRD